MQSIFDIFSTNNQQHSKKFQKEKLSIKDIFFTSFQIIISRKYFILLQKWANKHNSVPYMERR